MDTEFHINIAKINIVEVTDDIKITVMVEVNSRYHTFTEELKRLEQTYEKGEELYEYENANIMFPVNGRKPLTIMISLLKINKESHCKIIYNESDKIQRTKMYVLIKENDTGDYKATLMDDNHIEL